MIFRGFFSFLRPVFGQGRLGHPQSLEYFVLVYIEGHISQHIYIANISKTKCFVGQGSRKWAPWAPLVTDKLRFDGQFLSEITYILAGKGVLWRKQATYDRNSLFVIVIEFMWKLSVADTDCLWQCKYPKYCISVICRELTKILIHALSWTISNKKILVTDKKYFLEAWFKHIQSPVIKQSCFFIPDCILPSFYLIFSAPR